MFVMMCGYVCGTCGGGGDVFAVPNAGDVPRGRHTAAEHGGWMKDVQRAWESSVSRTLPPLLHHCCEVSQQLMFLRLIGVARLVFCDGMV